MTGTPDIGLPAGATRVDASREIRRRLEAGGVAAAALEARRLLFEALGIEAAELVARPQIRLADHERQRLALLLRRRLRGEPIGRMLGEREFWGLPFALGPETLEPRPDSETVIQTTLDLAGSLDGSRSVLDLGTGSGCLLVALLSEWRQARGVGVDRSPGALATARGNAARNGVGERALFAASDWGTALAGSFDVIVSNPPYIRSGDIAGLSVEVRDHDPILALEGGEDGLAAYRILLPDCARLLARDGVAVVEIGRGQAAAVASIGCRSGLDLAGVSPDLSATPRAVAFRRSEPFGGRRGPAVEAHGAPTKNRLLKEQKPG